MNLQKNYELRLAAQAIGEALQKIPQYHGGAKTKNDLFSGSQVELGNQNVTQASLGDLSNAEQGWGTK